MQSAERLAKVVTKSTAVAVKTASEDVGVMCYALLCF